MRASLIKSLDALGRLKEPATVKQVQAVTGLSPAVQSSALVELYDNLYVDREHQGGRLGYLYELLDKGEQVLQIAIRGNECGY